ncbi:MAG: 2Fe-2S iron-sulfur cluster-binding protein [Pseudomonadota bacterium]
MTGTRLASGGVIDRDQRVSFWWDGRRMQGCAGDTLASALLANGERVVARGFKYHRPRGVMAAGPEEGGALVTTGRGAHRVPNVKAPEVELYPGLEAFGQNAWPSVRYDLGQVNDLLGRFFAAGFYYKTFFGMLGKGTWEWMQFEKVIRRAAGMGSASGEADPDAYEIVHDHCDLLVIGSGPAGLAAAEQAVSAGLDVMIAEQDFALGGTAIGSREEVEGAPISAWLEAHGRPLAKARVLLRTTAIGLYDANVVGLYEKVTDHTGRPDPALPRGRLRIVRPGAVLLATGAIERPFAFGNNDRPGVMLAGALATYAERFGVAVGQSAAIATTNDSGYGVARALAAAGLRATVLDAREAPGAVAEAAEAAGVEVMAGAVPVDVKGGPSMRALEWARLHEGETRVAGTLYRDCLGVSGGWSPAIHLVCHRGVKPSWNEELKCFLSGEPPEGVALTGAAAGVFETEAAITHARASSADLIGRLTGRRRAAPNRPGPGGLGEIAPVWEVRVRGRKLKAFVDPQHDVTTADVRQAAREGYVSVEHMKRYTTLGMATDQGKTGGVLGLALLAEALDQTIPETGITTFRPPYTPTPIGAFAGRARGAHWRPTRRTPMHAVQAEAGAIFTDAGLWKRAWYTPARRSETLSVAYVREAKTVRERVGMVDVTSLGKIQVQGPDAAELLNRVYVNGFAKLPVMKCRYGVMLRDDGIVYDDGVTWRLGEHEFLMTATTAQAAGVLAWLEMLLQTRWPELRVHVASTTDQWAGIAVAGPRARAALEPIVADAMDNDALPFMGILRSEVVVDGGRVPVLIARISFSGEMAYEVYTPSDYGPALWAALRTRVAEEGGCVYGMEALGALRIEKGHVTHAELDGRVTLEDAGLGRMASTKKAYIGQALRKRPDLAQSDRPQLAHFEPVDPAQRFMIGAIVCAPDHVEGHGLGWITGVTVAPAFEGRWVGIGLVAGGPEAWEGREVVIADPVRGRQCRARVLSPHRYDPKGERMHG